MSEEQVQVKVKDESQDQKYFTITPRLIWALSRNPYDYTLWSTIKGIAGESGECFLSTEELAVLSMMSAGQAHESRKYWMEMKMLFGDLRKDPGYPQAVWHMSIPNVWAVNIEWATRFTSLKDRVQFKREQASSIREERQKSREEAKKSEKTPEESLHHVKPSPYEGINSPGEPEPSPGELKNIHKKNHKEELGAGAPPTVWGLGWQVAAGVEEVTPPTPEELENARLANAVGMFAPVYQPFVRAFILATDIYPLEKFVSSWSEAFKQQLASTGLHQDDVKDACVEMRKDHLTIKDPWSILNKIPDIRAKRKEKATITPIVVDSPYARSYDTPPVPPSPEFLARKQEIFERMNKKKANA